MDDICLDTGCSQSLVHARLFDPSQFIPGASVEIQCAHGDVSSYPVADVSVCVGGLSHEVHAGVSLVLPSSVLLGTDVPDLLSHLTAPVDTCYVVTRAQQQRQAQSTALRLSCHAQSNACPTRLLEQGSEDNRPHQDLLDKTGVQLTDDTQRVLWDALPDSPILDMSASNPKDHCSRKQVRAQNLAHRPAGAVGEEVSSMLSTLSMSVSKIRVLQQADPSPQVAMESARLESSPYYLDDGVLHRSAPSSHGRITRRDQLSRLKRKGVHKCFW